jgi:predicted small secreted protein
MRTTEEIVMKKIVNITLLSILCSSTLVLTGCNTVKGAFQGAGQDAQSISHQLQLDDNQSRHVTKKRYVSTTTTTSAKPVSSVETYQSTTTTTTTAAPSTPSAPLPLSPSEIKN